MAPKVAFHNLGCKVNAYEVEAMQQALEAEGYEIVPFAPGADVYVINTCTVTHTADHKSRQLLHRARHIAPGAVVVAIGCYAELHREELQKDGSVDVILGNNRKGHLAEEIAAFRRGNGGEGDPVQRERGEENGLQLSYTKEHTRAFLKVQDGCDRFCTYCIIPYARGSVRSRTPDAVREEVERLLQTGVREIVLTGIHLCSYGKDLDAETDLLTLIQQVHEAPGLNRLRLGSLEPSFLTERVVGELAKLPRLCPHFHVSLQSGCDATLRRMGRRYTTEAYAQTVGLLRRSFVQPALTTDLIVGFPGETEQEFAETRAFVEQMRFFETHIFPYSRRAGTGAAELPGQCTDEIKKERSRLLQQLHRRQQQSFLETFLDTPVEVLWEEEKQIGEKQMLCGHGRQYQKVCMSGTPALCGTISTVLPTAVSQGVLLA